LVEPLLTDSQSLAAKTEAYLTTKHLDYAVLAARTAISNFHEETEKNVSQVIEVLCDYGEAFYVLIDHYLTVV